MDLSAFHVGHPDLDAVPDPQSVPRAAVQRAGTALFGALANGIDPGALQPLGEDFQPCGSLDAETYVSVMGGEDDDADVTADENGFRGTTGNSEHECTPLPVWLSR